MAGTIDGGKMAARTNIKLYGEDFYRRIGAIGGKKSGAGGFACKEVDANGMTGRDRARLHGAKGGRISRRTKSEV